MNTSAIALDLQSEASKGVAEAFLFGRFMLPDHSEHSCRVREITPDHVVLSSDAVVEEGMHVVAYIDEIGRVDGEVEAVDGERFTLRFRQTAGRRERIFRRLEWLRDKMQGKVSDQRRHERYKPRDSKSRIVLPDGRSYPCEVLDISLSGASIKTAVLPALGTHVMLGKMHGRVVRYHEHGIAVEFVRLLDHNTLRSQIRQPGE